MSIQVKGERYYRSIAEQFRHNAMFFERHVGELRRQRAALLRVRCAQAVADRFWDLWLDACKKADAAGGVA